MPSRVSDQALGNAILQSVEHGSFPQSEDVASASVSSASLPQLLEVIGKAREDTRNEIRKVSREAASDVDGWIAQARRLQDDIKRSQETAKTVVQQAESGKDGTTRVQDAAAKVSFLHSEIEYNESLVRVVEQLQDIQTLLDSAQDAAVHSHTIYALERLEDADSAFMQLGAFQNTRVVGVLKERANQLRTAIVENVTESWNGLLLIDPADQKITLKEQIERESSLHITTVVEALAKLNLLDDYILRLSRDFDRIIIAPRFVIDHKQTVSAFEIDRDDIQIKGEANDMSTKAALEGIQVIAEYLSTRLPPSIAVPLSEKLVPNLASRLITNWLLPSVPLVTGDVPEFQETLSLVLSLAEFFDELEWSGQDRLKEWVDKSAEIWLARQKEVAIRKVQLLFPKRVQDKKTVERVETQVISKGDAMLAGQAEQEDDWGAEWDDEDESAKEEAKPQSQEIEEEDMSAWGVDDDDEPPEDQKEDAKAEKSEQVDEDTEDWGAEWGDDEDAKPTAPELSKPVEQHGTNGKAAAPQKPAANQEVTLRETYTVTAIPDSIIEVILQVVSDVYTLNSPELVQSTISPASGGLYATPSLLLAMYRATAAAHYAKHLSGNMLIYNDCVRLSDRLRMFLREQTEKDKTSNLPQHLQASVRLRTKLEHDIKAIEGFGKRAFGREMESQRQVIRDHLGDAQGFQNCVEAPFATVCDDAIATTIDRITEVKRQWQSILSHSVLLQSLGSLVSTALTKFIADVEDMPDIPEAESKKLHGYCVSLTSLGSHFQTDDESGEVRDMASVYTPNWFKFVYLSEILDSSLADIRYFWTDGGLKLEMDAEEVVDLIKALFAESDYRRKAIADIRRTSMG